MVNVTAYAVWDHNLERFVSERSTAGAAVLELDRLLRLQPHRRIDLMVSAACEFHDRPLVGCAGCRADAEAAPEATQGAQVAPAGASMAAVKRRRVRGAEKG